MQETWAWSPGWEDPLEKEMATHTSILIEEITSLVPYDYVHFISVQSFSHVQLFETPWIAARQASLSITNSQSSLRFTPIESVMPSSHLILCLPGGSVRNPTSGKVMRQISDVQGRVRSQVFPLVFPEHVPPKIRVCLPYCIVLFNSPDTLWKKSSQGFSLLHLKGCFNPKTPLVAF